MEQFEKIVLEAPEDKFTYFTKITAEDREKVKEWLKTQNGKTEQEKSFLERVKYAIQVVDYDYWIANLEPSVSEGKIYYAEGESAGGAFYCSQWWQMAKEFAPKRGSRLAKLHELLIWYALRVVKGLWTLKFVTEYSSSAGNYWDAPKCREKTGARECGGYRDGQGNTAKIVTAGGDYAIVGGCCCGIGVFDFPVTFVIYCDFPYNAINDSASGVLVLTK